MDDAIDSGLIKFNNKNQLSMYFIACKTLDYLISQNITISDKLYTELISKVIPELILEYSNNLKKRCKKVINKDIICIGRKNDGTQCTRKKTVNSNYCKSHYAKQSIPITLKFIKPPVKHKNKVKFDPRRYDTEYITLWEDIIDGEKVLLDNANNIYTFNTTNPILIGVKDVNNPIDIKTLLAKHTKIET